MWVVKLGGSLSGQSPDSSPLRAWLALLALEGAGQVVIVPGGGTFADAVRDAQAQWRFDDLAAHNMAVLAMAQTAQLMCALQPMLRCCDREADLGDALRRGASVVWSPLELRRDQADADTDWDFTSDSIALALAVRLRATRLVVVKSCRIDPAAALCDLAANGIVDPRFAAIASGASMPIEVVDSSQRQRIRDSLLE
ncbi:MAG: aspartate kinase [Rhizobacter sp.]